MVSTAPSKSDYLKRYLSGPEKPKKSKKKSKKTGNVGLSIESDSAFAIVAPGTSKLRYESEEEDSDYEEKKLIEKAKKKVGFKTNTFQEIEEIPVAPRQRHDSASPPPVKVEVQSSPRRNRHDSEASDQSPARRKRTSNDRNEEDQSPPRRRRRNSDVSDQSPPRRRRRHDSNGSDQSPPRRRRRRSRSSDDRSPSRRRMRNLEVDERQSRRRRHDSNSSDQSPPRHKRRNDRKSPERSPKQKPKEVKKEPVEEKTERTTGLLSREEMREKAQRDREEHERLLATIKDSGRDAEAVHRGGDGRKKRLTREEVERNEREAKKQEELNAKYEAVSKGVAQKEERERKIKEMEQTVQEDFTRHADDKTMNEHLKDQLMGEDDPMMQSISAKRMKIKLKSEFVYPTYNGQCPVNRYNIAPGYRWDGVDRSNGFESKMALRGNRELAEAAAAYRAIAEIAE
ncbi:BUD13-like protein [Aphelenchoides besseyi]|nr:BUD13-like protein [Aphelenchoides besseyi]